MGKQAINLNIAGKKYALTIASEKEEMYRLAEREVNKFLSLLMANKYREWTTQDYLAMAALKFAIENLSMRNNRELDGEDLSRLEELDSQIDTYLNKLPDTK